MRAAFLALGEMVKFEQDLYFLTLDFLRWWDKAKRELLKEQVQILYLRYGDDKGIGVMQVAVQLEGDNDWTPFHNYPIPEGFGVEKFMQVVVARLAQLLLVHDLLYLGMDSITVRFGTARCPDPECASLLKFAGDGMRPSTFTWACSRCGKGGGGVFTS